MSRTRTDHCRNGHPRTPENVTKNRSCKICRAERAAAKYWAAKGTEAPPTNTGNEADRTAYNTRARDRYIAQRNQRLARQCHSLPRTHHWASLTTGSTSHPQGPSVRTSAAQPRWDSPAPSSTPTPAKPSPHK